MTDYVIRPAESDDCSFIAEGILEAVGPKLTNGLGKNIKPGKGNAKDLFTFVSSKDVSQYSYRNSLIACTPEGERAGVIVAYDGADLHKLRKAFVEAYNARCGTHLKEEDFDDETSDDEIYIDTLMVSENHRRQGLGRRLIDAVEAKFGDQEKPLGLLCAFDNLNAYKLYEKLGFETEGTRKFCGEEMLHLQKKRK